MKKIIICLLNIIALIFIFSMKSQAVVHVAIIDEEYLAQKQQQYEQKQEKLKQEAKAKEEKAKQEKAKQEAKLEKERKEAEKKRNEEKPLNKAKATSYNFTKEEIEILYKICHAESNGEGERGQMAVANVILNRVQSGKFPNTIKGVVFQDGQFTPAASSSFHSIKPSSQVKASVQKVLKGQRVVEKDVLYFKSTRSKAKWSNYKLKAKIGRHLFYSR